MYTDFIYFFSNLFTTKETKRVKFKVTYSSQCIQTRIWTI